ncbi:T9SS type A sorting domain-containing protein [bacterium]|nr:T9SS type A sorting domain-containing protein [bacterium]
MKLWISLFSIVFSMVCCFATASARTGGPDEFGYFFIDSEEEEGPEFEWQEIEIPQTLEGIPANSMHGPFEIGFPFPFYEGFHSQLWLCSNGYVTFYDGQAARFTNLYIPENPLPNAMIAALWDDLDPSEAGSIEVGRSVDGNYIISYYDIPHYSEDGTATFQIVLSPDGRITIQWLAITFPAGLNTVGIEDVTGEIGSVYAYNGNPQGYPSDSLAVRFYVENGSRLFGTVIDQSTFFPVENALVQVPGYSVLTNDLGEYEFTSLQPRGYPVTVTADGFVISFNENVQLVGDEWEYHVQLIPAPELNLPIDELLFEAEGDSSDTLVVTIENTGESPLNIRFSSLYLNQFQPIQFMNLNRERIRRLVIDANDPVTEAPASDLNIFPQLPATPRQDELDDPNVLLVEDVLPWGYASTNEVLNLMEVSYDVVNSSALQGMDFTDYSVLIFGSHQPDEFYSNFAEVLPSISAFVEAGGWLEFHGALPEDFLDEWVLPGGVSVSYWNNEYNYIIDFNHPLVAGLASPMYGNVVSHGLLTNLNQLPDGYRTIMNSSLGLPTTVEYNWGQGTVLVTTQTWEWGWENLFPHGVCLANALMYTTQQSNGAFSWLSTDPDTTSIPPGEMEDISVIANSGMPPIPDGYYQGFLEITTNDPLQPLTTIPATFSVGAASRFQAVIPTGVEYPVHVIGAAGIDTPLEAGDAIGVFDGELCVGAASISDEHPLTISCWAEDLNREMPGFQEDNPISFKIWYEDDLQPVDAAVVYTHGNGTFGYEEGSTVSVSGGDYFVQVQQLRRRYFELISLYTLPENRNAIDVFGDIADLAIVYQNDGRVFIPPNINSIGNVSPSYAYQIFCQQASEFRVEGSLVAENTTYVMHPNRWNWLANPLRSPVDPDIALADIAESVVILLDNNGNLWIPGVFNTLGLMRPGIAYFAFVNEEVIFQYPRDLAIVNSFDPARELDEHASVVQNFQDKTGKPWPILITLDHQLLDSNPAQVNILDGTQIVGSALINDIPEEGLIPVIAWEGDEKFKLPGFIAGNEVKFELSDQFGNPISFQLNRNTPLHFYEKPFAEVALGSVFMELPEIFMVQDIYPNPFNATTTITLQLPDNADVHFHLYNLNGQLISSSSKSFRAGQHRYDLDFSTISNSASGIYLLKVSTESVSSVHKLMLIK